MLFSEYPVNIVSSFYDAAKKQYDLGVRNIEMVSALVYSAAVYPSLTAQGPYKPYSDNWL